MRPSRIREARGGAGRDAARHRNCIDRTISRRSTECRRRDTWWRHSQALLANKQATAAREALEMAYRFMLKGIAGLSDEGLRRNYLNKIEAHREIVARLAEGRAQAPPVRGADVPPT